MTTPIVNRLHFYHDAQGRVALVDFNGTKYSYARNLQGDIIGILGNSGNPGPDSTRFCSNRSTRKATDFVRL